jgi:predicted ATPase
VKDISPHSLSGSPLPARASWIINFATASPALRGNGDHGHAATMMYALSHGAFARYQCGNYASANAVFDELAALAEEKGTLFWKAFGIMNQGCVRALIGQPLDAVRIITSGWQSTGATMWMLFFLSYLARAHAELGKFEDAWCSICEAMATIETSKERWCEAEVHRIAGEITLLAPEPDAARAEAYFEHALAIARAQRAKSWGDEHGAAMARSGQRG